MDQSLTGFDRLAPVYDRFAKFVYGPAIREAQLCFLESIPAAANVLMVGGGTGWLLDEVLKLCPQCHVCYIEASAKMLTLAQERLSPEQRDRVKFILGTENSIPSDTPFDAVITAFYLDLFSSLTLLGVIGKIKRVLAPGSVWLVSDFIERNVWWQRVLLQVMYKFFRWCCGIEARRLPPWEHHMAVQGLRMEEEQLFFRDFIKSARYTVQPA